MNLLKDQKTNWKYILIVLILAIIVGGGILSWIKMQEVSPVELLEIKKPEKIEVTEELANRILDKITLDTKKYDRERAKFFINDLNNDKTPEIIVCLATPASLTWEAGEIEAYMTVVIPTDKNGNYKTIGDFIFNKEKGTPFLGRPCVAGVDESGEIYGYGEDIYGDRGGFVDIDGDGKKEMIVNLGLLGASGSAYTIFKIDWDLHKLNRIKVRDKEGNVEDHYFVEAFALMHRAGFHLEDVDNDKTIEIVEVYDSYVESKSETNLVEKNIAGEELYWKREYAVYKWDGSILNYNKELSNLLLETLNWKTYRNEDYGFEIKYPEEAEKQVSNLLFPSPSAIFRIGLSPLTSEWPSLFEITVADLKDCFSSFLEGGIEKKKVTINNLDFCLNIGHEGAPGGTVNKTYDYVIKKGEKYIILRFGIVYNVRCGEEYECEKFDEAKDTKVFNQMLSTFKFIEPKETECDKWRKECAEEGENLCSPCGCKSCCPGLVKRDVTYPYRNKNNEVFCLEEMTAYTCVKCGDKICGKGEDWCICPEDCPKPNPEDLQIFIMPE